ncbi:uncharacterized protein SPAPADRAFT_147975 [Spathaspora passalidarum NRRL Y-27907]|uniref:Uncharacterized protein n=1 Tax=Spathaspora passalidarum (strain NRRL Y-27907 / 11-Y1) TaxID=619300 RepID=G3AJ87_SPAPN|nr:uncharacterized protein SPAPADRAFT_147975 [Spathaspora passalidarum NRRL Y-27907]EGW33844.1 hypothetical protein SPAPADRAFT_147975 [Spathaspora passalidarum NRRL Y-27907]
MPELLSPQHSIDPEKFLIDDLHNSNIYLDPQDISDDSDEQEPPSPYHPDEDDHTPLSRQMSGMSTTEAASIVGGKSIETVYKEQHQADASHPIANNMKASSEQRFKASDSTFEDDNIKKYDTSQKVFSFSLPLGGLSNLTTSLFKPFQSLKLDLHNDERANLEREIELKLARQQSISTVDEAKYFRDFKGTDRGRFRAVKSSLTNNLNEILPDFIKREEQEPWESIYDRIEGNIVIMGGYRGSILRDAKTKKRLWIPLKAGFNLRKIDLLLGPNKSDELEAEKKIYPDGMLTNIGPIDISKKLIKKLQANPKVNLKEFGYDWRLGGDYVSKKLEEFLQKIYDETGKPTLVIAHSMGGLMVTGTVQRNPKLFRSVIYVGSPSECLNILGPIRFGDSVMFSDKILTYETNFMMRSSFIFLPLSGNVFYNKETKEPYNIDYFNADNWVEYNLNPLVAKSRKIAEEMGSMKRTSSNDSSLFFPAINQIGIRLNRMYRSKTTSTFLHTGELNSTPIAISHSQSTENTVKYSFTFSEAYEYLKRTLAETKEYLLSLDYRPELAAEYPPMAIVYGNSIPSVRGSSVRSRQDIKDGNYYEFFYGHGDGVVHQRWLMPERKGFAHYDPATGEGEIVGKFASPAGHVNLMTDFKAMGQALDAVFEAEKVWAIKKLRSRRVMKEEYLNYV